MAPQSFHPIVFKLDIWYVDRMADLKRELDEVTRGKDALERLSYQLIDEMRNTKNKVEQQQVEFQSSAQDFKNKGKKLEEENRQMVSELGDVFLKNVDHHELLNVLHKSNASVLRLTITTSISQYMCSHSFQNL